MFRYILITACLSILSQINQISAQNSNVTSNKQVVSGMVLKNDKAAFDSKSFLSDLGSEWKLKTDSVVQHGQNLVFSSGQITITVSNMDYPLPPADIAAAAEISWLWKTAETDAARHKSYLLISVIGTPGQTVKLYKLLTTVAACALENTNSSGIYLQNQYLLLSKGYFTEAAKNMSDENLPVYLWVYFGILQENGQNSGYTYGLKEFGMQELEIVNSGRSLQEVHACIVDATQLILKTNRRLQDGEEVTGGDGEVTQKIKVKLSNGAFLEGQTLKLAF